MDIHIANYIHTCITNLGFRISYTIVKQMLRDRIVCGINDPRIQCRLLAERELTYQSAFELVQSMETANQNTNDLQAPPRSEPRSRQDDFHYIPRAGNQTPRYVCYHCGGNHKAPDCKYKDAICKNCSKKVPWQKCVAVHQLGQKFRGTRSSDSRIMQKRTLRLQRLTIWK